MIKWILRLGAVGIVAAVAFVAVLVGCSSSGTPSSSMTPMTTPATHAKATAPKKATSPVMPGSSMMPSSPGMMTSPAPMTTPQCSPSNTSVSLGMGNGAAGTLYETLVIRNTSMSDCVTGGYSGISLDTAMGSQLGPAASRQGSPGAEVTLHPGSEATEVFSYMDAAVSTEMGCNPEPGASLRVYLPNASGFVTLPFTHDGCSGMISYLNVWAVNVAPGM